MSTSAGAKLGTGHRQPSLSPTRRGTLTGFSALLLVLLLGTFVQTFVLQTYRIPSSSMEPALQVGDCVLVQKLLVPDGGPGSRWARFGNWLVPPAAIHRGDMLVFHYPPDPRRELVKRVVALPGEQVRLREGRVYLNGQAMPEPYAFYTPSQPEVFRDEFPNLNEVDPDVDPRWWRYLRHSGAHGVVTVPEDSFFVLGDNRNNSVDSRYWGFVPKAAVVGRAVLVYFAVPNGADAPGGGPWQRLLWVGGYLRQRVGLLH